MGPEKMLEEDGHLENAMCGSCVAGLHDGCPKVMYQGPNWTLWCSCHLRGHVDDEPKKLSEEDDRGRGGGLRRIELGGPGEAA